MQGVPATEATKHTFQASSGHGRVLEGGKLLSEAAFAAAFLPAAPFAPAFLAFLSSSAATISSILVSGLPTISSAGASAASAAFGAPAASGTHRA